MCIAKQNETILTDAIARYQEGQDKLNREADGLRMKIKNLANIVPKLDGGSSLNAICEPLENLVLELKDNTKAIEGVLAPVEAPVDASE